VLLRETQDAYVHWFALSVIEVKKKKNTRFLFLPT